MYYGMIGIISIIIHLIVNHEYFRNKEEKSEVNKVFKRYIWAVLAYYITDVVWGIIYSMHVPASIIYIDTVFYHVAMASTVVLLCRYVTTYLKLNTAFGRFINKFGIIFAIFEMTLLFINHFKHIFFWIDPDGTYHAYVMRYVALGIQVFLCVLLAIQTGFIMKRAVGEMRERYFTIYLFCIEMLIAILVQMLYPLLPLYSIGLVVGISIIHTFVKEAEKEEQYRVLTSMADIFYSAHVIDLINDTAVEFRAQNEVKEIADHNDCATEMMYDVINSVVTEQYKNVALEFTNLNTVADRMKNRKTISSQFVGKHVGWFIAMFITIEADHEGRPTKVMYTTRVIDEEKKQEERLIKKSNTDELTGLLNRRAYEENIYEHDEIPEDFNYVSLDVNGLKVINDTKGHMAGDELIIGACECMKDSFGPYGKLYRIGGDEFVAILLCDAKKVNEILTDFDNVISNWSGELVDGLSISYGWVSRKENPDASVRQLSAIAEQRMYEKKAAYYRKKGVDRRGQQDAHKALCELYTKILKINISDDTYQIINMDETEQTHEKGFSNKISEWLFLFGTSGHVHPDDLEEYIKTTDIGYMRDYFTRNKTSLHIFYRRKYKDTFKQAMMEIIKANDYSDDDQSLFLYVKEIDK